MSKKNLRKLIDDCKLRNNICVNWTIFSSRRFNKFHNCSKNGEITITYLDKIIRNSL